MPVATKCGVLVVCPGKTSRTGANAESLTKRRITKLAAYRVTDSDTPRYMYDAPHCHCNEGLGALGTNQAA
jgi:hypothetical protein